MRYGIPLLAASLAVALPPPPADSAPQPPAATAEPIGPPQESEPAKP